jgi:hypothetical protein
MKIATNVSWDREKIMDFRKVSIISSWWAKALDLRRFRGASWRSSEVVGARWFSAVPADFAAGIYGVSGPVLRQKGAQRVGKVLVICVGSAGESGPL